MDSSGSADNYGSIDKFDSINGSVDSSIDSQWIILVLQMGSGSEASSEASSRSSSYYLDSNY
jgi:hypothetical protein